MRNKTFRVSHYGDSPEVQVQSHSPEAQVQSHSSKATGPKPQDLRMG